MSMMEKTLCRVRPGASLTPYTQATPLDDGALIGMQGHDGPCSVAWPTFLESVGLDPFGHVGCVLRTRPVTSRHGTNDAIMEPRGQVSLPVVRHCAIQGNIQHAATIQYTLHTSLRHLRYRLCAACSMAAIHQPVLPCGLGVLVEREQTV